MMQRLCAHRSTLTGLTVVLFMLAAPAMARADWLLTPALGGTLGRDTHGREHVLFRTAIGWTDYDPPYGWEVDLAFAPDFFEGDDDLFEFDGDSHVATLMFNGTIGDLAAISDSRGWRPYLTAGGGVIRVRVATPGDVPGTLFKSRVHEFGVNAGGGIVAFVHRHVGIRADLRYVTSLEDDEPSWTQGPSTFDVAPGRFDFFTATVGLMLRFP